MIKSRFLTALLLIVCQVTTAQNWIQQNLENLAIASFPEKPSQIDTLAFHFFKYQTDTAFYYVQMSPIPDNRVDLSTKENLEDFYTGMVKGIIGKAQGKLISKQQINTDGIDGIQIEFISDAQPNAPNLKFLQIFMIGKTSLIQGFLTDTAFKTATEIERNRFFKSLKITAKGITKSEAAEETFTPEKLGYLAGQIVFAVLVIIGIVFLVRKLTK